MPKLLYFLKTSTRFINPTLLEMYDKTVRDGLWKVCKASFVKLSKTQLALSAELGRLELHPHRFWHFLPHWPQLRRE